MISRQAVKEANPKFFSPEMLKFNGHGDSDWELIEQNNQHFVVIYRAKAQCWSYFLIDAVDLKLSFNRQVSVKVINL